MMENVNVTEEATVQTQEDTKSESVEEVANTEAEETEEVAEESVDYEALIESDLNTLRAEFPELGDIKQITDLNNPLRYAALRDLGLTPEEAYLATAKRRSQDTRAHLRSAHGRNASTPLGIMSQHELSVARELFPGLSDADIQRLYKKVTK